RNQAFERGQPIVVVVRSIVDVAPCCRRSDFVGQRRGPLFPGEVTLLGKFHRHRKRLRLPWFRKDWTVFVARQRRQRVETFGDLLFVPSAAITRVQGSPPTNQRKSRRASTGRHPTARVR